MTNLSGKVAVVTGAGSGIGEACAELLVERGSRVVIADIDEAAANGVSERLGETAVAHRTDVTVEGDVNAMVQKAVSHFGRRWLHRAVTGFGVLLGRTWYQTCGPHHTKNDITRL